MDRKEQIVGLIDNYHAFFQTMVKLTPHFFNNLKVTYTQMLILSFIKENEDISVKRLAATMGITSSAATQQLNSLVKKGYLVRKESNIDRRTVKIRLSPKMEKQIEVIEAMFLDKLFTLFDGITDEELTLYCNVHSKIAGQIKHR